MTFRGQTEIDTLSPQAAGAYVNAKRKKKSPFFGKFWDIPYNYPFSCQISPSPKLHPLKDKNFL